jgi:hypothetical protein
VAVVTTMTEGQRCLAECLHRAVPEAPTTWTPGRYRCPVCSKTPNDKRLVVGYNDKTREAWFTCHGGCDRAALRSAFGIRSMAMLRDPGSGAGATPAGEYIYVDEHGRPLFKVARWVAPASRRYSIRADDGGWQWAPKGWHRPYVLYHADAVADAVQGEQIIWLCASEADADAARQVGGADAATATPEPPSRQDKGGFRVEYCEVLRGAVVRIVATKDDGGRQRAQMIARALTGGRYTESADVFEPAGNDTVKTLRDHLAAGYALDDLAPLQEGGGHKPGSVDELPARCSLETVEKLFGLLVEHGDLVALRATLACYAANMRLAGDPVWLGLISGSSTGKTETAMALARCPGVLVRSTISGEAAFLSATPAKDWAPDATGGLLRRVGDLGVLALKDFTSILSMDRHKRGYVLSALREIFDGSWSRELGAEGGRFLEWRGKLGLVMCCTTAYDRAYAVLGELGDRFLLLRLTDDDPAGGMLAALAGAGQEADGRELLASAAAGLLGHPPEHDPLEATPEDLRSFAALADFLTLARSPVARDYRGEVELIHAREGPYRFGKELYALWRAGGLLGLDREQAWEVARRVARDSMPRLRWLVIAALAEGEELTTDQVRRAVWHPKQTTKRTLEDLVAHRVAKLRSHAELGTREDFWRLAAQPRTVARFLAGIEPEMWPPPVEDAES